MSNNGSSFAYIRQLNADAIQASCAAKQRYSQEMIGRSSGGTSCTVSYIAVPVGSGSPAGLHVHEVDQMFYILSGSLNVEVDGMVRNVNPGSLVVFPAGVPHRNWNDGPEEAVYLAINAPLSHPSDSAKPI